MPNPFQPGAVYYVDVSPEGLRDNECRDNPTKGPRPWVIIYSRQRKQSKTVIAAPLYSRGNRDMATHFPVSLDDFDVRDGQFDQAEWVHLEQLRALDCARFKLTRGPMACMTKAALRRMRGHLIGMFDHRLLPPSSL